MEDANIERLPLTPREEEAAQELKANWRTLQPLPKPTRVKRRRRMIQAEQLPLTDREREAEAEQEAQKLGIALLF